MSILMPNVPFTPGIPGVLRSEVFPFVEVTEDISAISNVVKSLASAKTWGLFDLDGNILAQADSVISIDVADSANIPTYPMESGGFGSLNKIVMPSVTHLKIAHGGTVDSRSEFWQALDDARRSTDLFNIVTPEVVYLNVNVTGVRRSADATHNVTLATAELEITEVNLSIKTKYARELVDNGSVQTK